MTSKLIFILLFLLLVSIVIFGGYFISTKNIQDKIEDKTLKNIKSYQFFKPAVISNKELFSEDNYEKIDSEDRLDFSSENSNNDDGNHRKKIVECYQNSDCGVDYEEEPYCVFNKVYKKVHIYSCDGQCKKEDKNLLVEKCLMGCSEGKCIDSFLFQCSFDYDCGFDDFIGERYCTNNNVFQHFVNWTCENPDSENSRCKINFEEKLVNECISPLVCDKGMCVE
ncbi:MAG: hypothetical protein AABW83_02770 [Nanoarchaeota archaeon]